MRRTGRPSQINKRKAQMASNGASAGFQDPGPDLVFDADNPPTVHECSLGDTFHLPTCSGDCADIPLDELDVDLINEQKAWTRAGMMIMVTPIGVADQVCVPGMKVSLFDLECKVMGLVNAVQEITGLNDDDINRHYKQAQLTRLKTVRELNEEAVRQQRTEATLGVIKKQLLGPHGEPL